MGGGLRLLKISFGIDEKALDEPVADDAKVGRHYRRTHGANDCLSDLRAGTLRGSTTASAKPSGSDAAAT